MDILQISYFSKVYETTNYAHAAESLCVSRQGLRKVMRNLEREVGQPLFVNVANRLQPTEAAHRLYKASRAFVEGFRELEDAVAAMKLSQKTEVRLGGTYDSDDVFTTAEWRAFRSYPTEEHDINVKLRYVRGSRRTLLAALLDGSLDYAHVVFTELDETRFECRIAREGRIFLTMRSDHPLAARAAVTIEDLRGVPLSMHCEGNGVADLMLREAQARGVALDVVRSDNELPLRLADAEDGRAATLTYLPLDDDPRHPNLVSAPFEEPALAWKYGVVARRGAGDSYMMRYFAGEEIDWPAIVREIDERKEKTG